MKNNVPALLVTISLFFCTSAQSAVQTGAIDDWAESSNFSFGDGVNNITMTWSRRSFIGGDGYFVGSESGYPDFFVVTGGVDVMTVSDASIFAYDGVTRVFHEGDTIFMRSIDGYYGALQVDLIYPNPSGEAFPYTYLNGSWYFQADGSANFVVPVPAALWLFGSGVFTLLLRRRTIVAP